MNTTAPPPGRAQVWNGVLADEEAPFEIRVEAGIPLGRGDLRHLLFEIDTGVAHHDVQGAPFVGRAVDQGFHLPLVADVAG